MKRTLYVIPTSAKIELIQRLASSGLSVIQATRFVSPKWAIHVQWLYIIYCISVSQCEFNMESFGTFFRKGNNDLFLYIPVGRCEGSNARRSLEVSDCQL